MRAYPGELIGTFTLVFIGTSVATATRDDAPASFAGLAIGGFLFVAHLVGAQLGGVGGSALGTEGVGGGNADHNGHADLPALLDGDAGDQLHYRNRSGEPDSP